MTYSIVHYQYVLACTLLLALITIKKQDAVVVAFLMIAVLCELVLGKRAGGNHTVFKYYSLICVAFYFVFFFRKITEVRYKVIVAALAYCWMVFVFLNTAIIQPESVLQPLSYAVGIAFVCLTVFVYVQRELASERIWLWQADDGFWLGLGIVLFSVPQLPILLNFEAILKLDQVYVDELYRLLPWSNMFLNLSYFMIVLVSARILPWKKPSAIQLY